MKVIYSSAFQNPFKATSVSLLTNDTTTPVDITTSVSGIALFDVDAGDINIQASTDDFSSTIYDQNFVVDGDLFVDLSSTPVVAAKWRIEANNSTSVGQLYVGTLINLTNPSFPFSFEKGIVANDRQTLTGINYSRIRYIARQGDWQWELIPSSELDSWKTWYSTTNGFRYPSVITDPIDSSPYYVVSPLNNFPLEQIFNDAFAGNLSIREVL